MTGSDSAHSLTEADLSKGNWLDPPYNRLSLQRMDAVLSTVPICHGDRPVREFERSAKRIEHIPFEGASGTSTVGEFLDRTFTDGLVVLSGDVLVHESYRNGLTPGTRHSMMSMSKSMAGMLAGKIWGRGLVDLLAQVGNLVPELRSSGYGDASVQQVLDMGVGMRFSQEYTDPTSDVQTQDRAAGWRERLPGDPEDSRRFLATLTKGSEHGGCLRYCSPTTDVLAWILERAAGRPYASLMTDELWSEIGAEHDAYVTVDASGVPYACAGMCCTLLDLARFGRLVLDGGMVGDRIVIPRQWIEEIQTGVGSRVDSAADHEFFAHAFPQAIYHNQWWTTRNDHMSLFGVGIFGQYLWLDPTSDVVVAKFSSMPAPLDPDVAYEHVVALDALARSLAS